MGSEMCIRDRTTAIASSGGKGGGQWLFVTHSALDTIPSMQSMIGSSSGSINTIMSSDDAIPPHARLLHFKFEAMILHILTSSLDAAKRVLAAAQTAGFRESGISSVSGPAGREADMVMVAVRSTGLATDAPIGYLIGEDGVGRTVALSVSDGYVRSLVEMANAKFHVNGERTRLFRRALLDQFGDSGRAAADWEPADVRKARKRDEGLRRQAERRSMDCQSPESTTDDLEHDHEKDEDGTDGQGDFALLEAT